LLLEGRAPPPDLFCTVVDALANVDIFALRTIFRAVRSVQTSASDGYFCRG